jgi:hypothetical protein
VGLDRGAAGLSEHKGPLPRFSPLGVPGVPGCPSRYSVKWQRHARDGSADYLALVLARSVVHVNEQFLAGVEAHLEALVGLLLFPRLALGRRFHEEPFGFVVKAFEQFHQVTQGCARGSRLPSPVPAGFGQPDRVFIDSDDPPGGELSLTYAPGPGMPRSRLTGVGLLVNEINGNIAPGFIGKFVPPATTDRASPRRRMLRDLDTGSACVLLQGRRPYLPNWQGAPGRQHVACPARFGRGKAEAIDRLLEAGH